MLKGKVFICGAGPGDPKLLTLRARELIDFCDVILYDRLINEDILSFIPVEKERIYVGREVGDPTTHQDNTNKIMVSFANQGKNVLRLKGGDPFIFGRGGEEAEFLIENNIEFEIIPGITSGIGSAIYAGIPLTHRRYSSSVVFVTGHEDPSKEESSVRWMQLPNSVDTIVIYMGISNAKEISQLLINGGMSKDVPAAVIENGTLPNQRTIVTSIGSLAVTIEENNIKPPAIIIIGKTIDLKTKLNWLNN